MHFSPAILALLAPFVAGRAFDTSPRPISLEGTELQRRAACAAAGVVNGQCGRYYRRVNCNDQIGSIDPGRCEETCYWSAYTIQSIKAVGDGTYGTNCQLFSDTDCLRPIGETGNAITGGGKCYTPRDTGGGRSFKCYRRCRK